MYFDESDVRQVTETVWNLMLHIPVSDSKQQLAHSGEMVAARVEIHGAWNGAVTIVCPAELARELAGTMYDSQGAPLPNGDVQDALGELTNMVGGNIRGMLPEDCQLSLPQKVTGGDCPAGKALYELGFSCQGKPFWLLLHELA